MNTITPKMLGKMIAAHPRSSLQDALLLLCLMMAALLLAIQYDLFYFIRELSDSERRISLAEAIFLTLLLMVCISVFVIRRLSDQRTDIALRTAAEIELQELTSLVMQDPLTTLLNRRALLTALDDATKTPPANGTENALFLMDLNGFKSVNDVYGHAVGDQVLEVVGKRFQAAARPSDLVARIGGDEFAVLAYNVDRATACQIGKRFDDSLTNRIRAGGHMHEISMAMGVVMIPGEASTTEEALQNADLAMYRAKELGRALMVFEPEMEQRRRQIA
ncbi:MAG: GGDEF domain-containing protein [Hyphomicrobiales bacterium]